jgi:TolA-binding protein
MTKKKLFFLKFSGVILVLIFLSPHLLVTAQEQSVPVREKNPAMEYAAGIAELGRGNYAEAQQRFTLVVKISTDPVLSARATFLTGWCSYKLSQWPEAADWFTRYLDNKGLLKDYAEYFRAISLTRGAQYKKAIPAWSAFFGSFPRSRWYFEARLTQADALEADKRCGEALTLMRNLLK